MSGEIEAMGALRPAVSSRTHWRARTMAMGTCTHARIAAPRSPGRSAMRAGNRGMFTARLRHVIEEFAHGVFHVESKGWRTLPMLIVNPGRLTREYIHGRRARYIAPLALFLFMVFLTFFTFGVTGASVVNLGDTKSDKPQAEAQKDLREAQREVAAAIHDPDTTPAERARAPGGARGRAGEARAGGEGDRQDAWESRIAKRHTIAGGFELGTDDPRSERARRDSRSILAIAPFDARVHHALEDPSSLHTKWRRKPPNFRSFSCR